ncbi:MAG TPA: acyl-CoA synthetase FdrA [Geminicoccaceae bacterium]|nr:acyl-CoA synthetase FdrA [Geminicoccaceae bacterium]
MARGERVVHNLYRDSVSLMQLSATLGRLPGVRQASAVMATAGNLELLREAGLIAAAVEPSPNDLLVAVEAADEAALADALGAAEAELSRAPAAQESGGPRRIPPKSLEMALGEVPTANLALISTPGDYAAAEAMKALRLGLNVMLFSDNVALEDEIELKTYAREHDLLVMGPDCGTAILSGIPLGFANAVRRGGIGAVAASGTGLQQVTCLIDRWGQGISQAIGTGGHDLSAEVGGITMLQGLKILAADPATRLVVLISKPPHPEVAERVLAAASQAGKPIVVNFLGADPSTVRRPNVHPVRTLEDAARLAVALAGDPDTAPGAARSDAAVDHPELAPGQRYVRGLYSGGTFCYEALLLLSEVLGPVRSNTPLDPSCRLADVWQSQGHTAIDLGDDVFTRGRPHPMIDQMLRCERMRKEAADAEVAVVLFDVVLGYGAHADPAAELVPAIQSARAAAGGREVAFVGSVCGTAADPQDLGRQEAALRDAGVMLADSNAQAVRMAARIAARSGG